MIPFEVISEIEDIEIIAVGNKIRDVERLRETYGSGRWRKLKGFSLAFDCLMIILNVMLNCIGMKRTESAKRK